LTIGFACAALAGAQPTLTAEQKRLNLESFEFIWSTIRDQHWDPTFGGVNWAAVHEEFRPRVERAATMPETRSLMGEMLGRLGKSHFAIIPADVYGDLDSHEDAGGTGTAGFDARVLEGHAIVTSVEEGSPAQVQGVRPGWGSSEHRWHGTGAAHSESCRAIPKRNHSRTVPGTIGAREAGGR
jgi:hypothetical protein